jgi:ribonuclease VapC
MIAVDTSALMAIILKEIDLEAYLVALGAEDKLLISAGTLAEALIVAARRNVGEQMVRLIDSLGVEVVNVTAASANQMARAYEHWGKGKHPAALNLGDCFAYVVAKEYQCGLLYVGEDFSKTDLGDAGGALGGSLTRIRT